MTRAFLPTAVIPVIASLAVFASGCSRPLLYKPSCDLTPVLTNAYPAHIETLASCPRDKTHVEGGINKNVGRRQPDDIKEMFDLTKDKTQYRFLLFFSDDAASKWDEFAALGHLVFNETTTNGCSGRLYYTEQPRADGGGGFAPLGYYVSRVCFRLHNAVITVEACHDKPQSDALSLAVVELARMLDGALAATDRNTR